MEAWRSLVSQLVMTHEDLEKCFHFEYKFIGFEFTRACFGCNSHWAT